MTPVRGWTWLAALLLLATATLAGCGKKADPRPAALYRPPVVSDLSAVSGPAGAELRWSVSGKVQRDWAFAVLRSESVDSEAFCPGCPQTYRPLTTLKSGDSRLKRIGEGRFGYDDPGLREGQVYLYRVSVCIDGGPCGSESNPAGPLRSRR